MIISIIYLIFSFILDNFMSGIFTSTLSTVSVFTTIYTIIALVVIYPYFSNDKKYFVLVGILGLLFDVVYTSTFLINIIIFLSVGILIKLLYNIFPENIFATNIISFVGILIYNIFCFLILSMVGYSHYHVLLLLKIAYSSIIMTIIYTTISYFIIKLTYRKLNLKQIK